MSFPSSRRRSALTAIAHAAALLAAGAMTAHAQETNTQSSEGLQVVTVTAQKRPQAMQDVPVAVSTVDERAIENQQIVGFSDLTRVAPALTINENPNNNNIALRGIGTFAFSIGIESAVSVIIDDVPVIQQLQAFSNLSDIARVEVLRGPQGTLFGKNSSAGVINIVTKESSEEQEGHAQVTVTSDGEKRLETGISGPISDKLGYRLNAYSGNREGDVTNLESGAKLNGERSKGARLRLDFKPTTSLDGRLIADYNKRRIEGPVTTFLSVPPGASLRGVAPIGPALVGITPGPDNRDVRMDDPGFAEHESRSIAGTLNWKLDNHTITSVTTWQDWEFDFLADFDGTNLDQLGPQSNGRFHGGVTAGGPYRSRMSTQELRLSSNGDGALTYLGGLYYADSRTERSYLRGPVSNLANWEARSGNQTAAAFAQAEYRITPATRVSTGVRFNRETIEVDFANRLPAVPAIFDGRSRDDATTGKVALQHDLVKDVMVYGSFATGYKGAGYDVSTGFNEARVRLPVAPETSESWELGMKSRFFRNRLQLNATVFHTDYEDFQAQSRRLDPLTQAYENVVTNVGELRTRGLELEVQAKPINTLLLEASVAWVDATIKKFPNTNCYPGQTAAEGCVLIGGVPLQDLSGKRLSNAPRTKLNLGATYNFPIGESGYSGIANINGQYQSSVNYDLAANPLADQKGYGTVNGSIAFFNPSQNVKLTFYVNNLFDKSYASFVGDNYNVFGNVHVLTQTLPRNSDRYFGVRMKYDF
ncbi:TonB-dependent receptor [Massilia sp. CFBP9012]|uniref:TonB-dependent receptor n=1 Tax=Massilia sp. CFBP9012 TaxID=3096531 RepID=UPI002A6B48A8|nr:TonB-dependent receptor [Massilia sp. CFBP9012]MDY0973490.1 TonB-dependent receptor [Massilia sp. CFBP9012]